MTNTNWLPKVLRWMFAILSFFSALGAVALLVLLLIDPNIPADLHFGPLKGDMMGQPVIITMRNFVFTITALRGALSLQVDNAAGLIDILKHHGLPVFILNAAVFAVIFDLLRRLFRNVGRGESFTQQNVRLVQIIGLSLLAFSIVSAIAESWFHYALFRYLAQHAVLVISGTALRLPVPVGFEVHGGGGFPFGSPVFFTGLLVLALSEVFRQGLVLKRESDLTV